MNRIVIKPRFFRIVGWTWFFSFLVWGIEGSVTAVPGSSADLVATFVGLAAYACFVVSSVVLLVAWAFAASTGQSAETKAVCHTMSRWLAAWGGGLLGGLAAGALFGNGAPGDWTCVLLAGLAGMLAGTVCRLLFRRPAAIAVAAAVVGVLAGIGFLALLDNLST